MSKAKSTSISNLLPLLQTALLTSASLLGIAYIGITLLKSEGYDFDVFFFSARNVIQGQSVYDIYGPIQLPYWYFPWLAWFFTPLALFSWNIAYVIYMAISVLCAGIVINILYQKMAPHTSLSERLLAFSMSLTLCWLLFRVGQMDFILLAVAVLMIQLVDTSRSHLAGLFVPILLFKPHLFLLFFVYLALKGGKPLIVSTAVVTILFIIISFVFTPDWHLQMLDMLKNSGQRTDHSDFNFTTLPNLLGSQENWSGTANLPLTVLLIIAGFLMIWNFKSLEIFPCLSLTLAGSLFCAPRAYAYNFPLLIPVMIWLSAGLPRGRFILFWIIVGLAPILLGYSTPSYLIVLAVFTAGIYKASYERKGIAMPSPTM